MTLKYIGDTLPPIGRLVSFCTPNTQLGSSEIAKIKCMVESYAGIRIDPSEIDWSPKTKEGTLIKRLKKYLYQRHKCKLKDEELALIGNEIVKSTPKPQAYALDITQSFDWAQGDFGDHQACFLNSQSSRRYAMNDDKDKRFYALRVFKKTPLGEHAQGASKYYKGYHGISRSWFWRYPIGDKFVIVVINGYGMQTIQQAALLSAYLKKPMKAVSVRNSKGMVGGLYANHSTGYAIGDKELLEKLSSVDISTK